MDKVREILRVLFKDTRCMIAFALTLSYCVAVFVLPTERLSVMSDIIKMVLCFYFGVRSSMSREE